MKKYLSLALVVTMAIIAGAAYAAIPETHTSMPGLAALAQGWSLAPALMGIGMTTLAKDASRTFFQGDFHDFPVIAADVIYGGAAVGDNGSGYARPLQAGDPFRGFADYQVDNLDGAAGDKYVRTRTRGRIKLAIAALAITDVGKDVYASDDDTFTLTQGSNTHIGHVVAWVETGYGIVEFTATTGVSTELTDSTGGAVDGTLAAVGATNGGDVSAAINNNFADLAAKVNYLLRRLGN
jgi:hypothetical protein